MPKHKSREAWTGFIYILPSLILILTFSVIPIFMSLYFSFTKYNILQSPEFIGFTNYVRMAKDKFILSSIQNTVSYVLMTVPVQTICSLILASLIAEFFRNRFGYFVKSALFIPVIASTVLIGTLWFTMLSPRGVVNAALQLFGLRSVNWLGSIQMALPSIAFISIWKNVGYFLVIYYAGIMDIPDSIYEAAEVDGANRLQKFIYITVPSLASVNYLVITLGTIWSFQVFDLVYTMTGGGPGMATNTLVLSIYNAAFKENSMGYATAISMLMLLLMALVTFLQKKLVKGGEVDA